MYLKDYYGNDVEVLNNVSISVGDKVVIMSNDKDSTLVSSIPTQMYVTFTVKAIIENGQRVKVNEMGGNWRIDLVYKIK